MGQKYITLLLGSLLTISVIVNSSEGATLPKSQTNDENDDQLQSEETTKKCSPPGYPCVPVHHLKNQQKFRKDLKSNSTEFDHPDQSACCSGVCLYEKGWIDAVCE